MPAKNLQRVSEGGIICHVYNKGIDGHNLFREEADYKVFIGFLQEYLSQAKTQESKKEFTVKGKVFRGLPHLPKNYFNKVELIAYSLKPDHFHLVLHQKTGDSLQAFIRSLCTRYSIYFNKKYHRSGTLFAGPYKSARINNKKVLQILTGHLHTGQGFSSLEEHVGSRNTKWVKTEFVQNDPKIGGKNVDNGTLTREEKEILGRILIEKPEDHHLERRDLKSMPIRPWRRIPELAGAITVFAVLLAIGLSNVMASNKSLSTRSTTVLAERISVPSPTPSVSPSPEPKTITVMSNDGPVNIREEASAKSKKVADGLDGEKFELLSERNGWYQIKTPDGISGYISSKYVQKEVKSE